MTNEEIKQQHIRDVIGTNNKNDFDMEKERDEDDIAKLLEEIDTLRMTLEDDGCSISNIPIVTDKDDIDKIRNIYKILKLKNDRIRYCGLAEETILSMAHGLEFLFDGEKEWLGRKPDLVGWSDTVKVKLKRSRYETSTLVRDIMQEYQMPIWVKLFFELVPSMFLYSRNKRIKQTGFRIAL